MSTSVHGSSAATASVSPVGRYRPQVLLLAPQQGEEAVCLSLVAQCLELGLSIELDEHWRLPTAPPRDLSAYQACLFPETARAQYDADLNAFSRAGGFLIYNKYYPLEPDGVIDHAANLIAFQGRDVMTQQFAAMLLQAGLTQHDPDFLAAMRARPLTSILEDQKAVTARRYARLTSARWNAWKDPDCLLLLGNLHIAQITGDEVLMQMVRAALDAACAAHDDLLRTDGKISSQLENYVEPYVQLFGWLLLLAGQQLGEPCYTQCGAALVRFWYEHNAASGYGGSARNLKGVTCEDVYCAPGLYWLTRVSGEQRYAEFADRIVSEAVRHCQRDSGIWSHWVDARGVHQSAWSRASGWPLLGLSCSLPALEADGERAHFIRSALTRTFDGLAAYQDPASGLWRNVIDEPFTRPESSGTTMAMFAYDLLKQMGLACPRHEAMMVRAFAGLLPLCYRQGISACCRGTDYGPPSYYRSRPQGYAPTSSFFVPVVAARISEQKKPTP